MSKPWETGEKADPSPETTSLFPFRISFEWLTPLIFKGLRKPLEMEDIFDLEEKDKANSLALEFSKHWDSTQNTKSKLLNALIKMFGWNFLLGSILKVLYDVCQLTTPIFMRQILQFIASPDQEWYEGYLWTAGLFFTQILQVIIGQQYFHVVMNIGMRVRTVLTEKTYKKSLMLSNQARQRKTTGEIVNLMSVDTQKIAMVITYLNMLWSGILQISVCLAFLFFLIGWVTVFGLIIMILLIPIQAVCARLMGRIRRNILKYTDERIKIINEVLQGIQVIKFFTWEDSFFKKINSIRKSELLQSFYMECVRVVLTTIMTGSPVFVSVVTFAAYSLFGNQLTATVIFPALAYFNLLRFPLTFFPMMIGSTIESLVSLNRLESFYTEEELVEDEPGDKFETPIIVSEASFEWSKPLVKTNNDKNKQKKKTEKTSLLKSDSLKEKVEVGKLNDINLTIKKGELCAIVGSVGSGKTSLVCAILGEMNRIKGNVLISGSTAYCSQQAWIQNATLRDNITFGLPYDKSKFDEIVKVCALTKDLEMLPAGELTEIGEKGINLSGGQRQRVSIARAVYADMDVYILDDPLSAVDAHVGKHIFEKCFKGYLKDKTRVLVTHQLQYLPQCDNIIVMDNGKIIAKGNYKKHIEERGLLANLLNQYLAKQEEEETEAVKRKKSIKELIKKQSKAELIRKYSEAKLKLEEKKLKKQGESTSQEERIKGGVPLRVIWDYVMALGGPIIAVFILVFFLLGQASVIAADWWMAQWTSGVFPHLTLEYNLLIYGCLGLSGALILFLRNIVFQVAGLIAAARMHTRALKRVLRAPMSFFGSTPSGRILSRFSKDQETADSALISVVSSFVQCLFQVIATFGIVVYATWWFVIPLIPILIIYYGIQQLYRRTSRELKRLDSISRSPLYNHFSESLTGLSTIRAYNKKKKFHKDNCAMLDYNQRPYYAQIVSQRWLSFRLEMIGAVLILAACIFSLTMVGVPPGVVGLSLTYAMQVSSVLSWAVRQATETETSMNSIERLLHYGKEIEIEKPEIIQRRRPKKTWPSKGKIEFENYQFRYKPNLPLVLKGVNISIKPGEKIGVVGRTGAGKSTLMLALFRIVEPAGGKIKIDDLDITNIGLYDLRSKISIIPQTPVMFAGTVRFNLDPFGFYSDMVIWDALKKANLKDAIKNLPKRLDAPVSEGGENFSVGQRQLICLARALLKKSKILVLDEATASVDIQTDALIQETVKKEFGHCTTLTIAHRLNTIIDYDKILVMDAGVVAEFDTPKNLVSNPNSTFLSMVNETGNSNAKLLIRLAKGEKEDSKIVKAIDGIGLETVVKFDNEKSTEKENKENDGVHFNENLINDSQ